MGLRARVAFAAILAGSVSAVVAWPTAAETASVTIVNFTFAPESVQVQMGPAEPGFPQAHAHVRFLMLDEGTQHNVTFEDQRVASSGPLGQNQIFDAVFTSTGTFAYRCTFHPSMGGTVIVTAMPAASTTTQPPVTAPPPTAPPTTGSVVTTTPTSVAVVATTAPTTTPPRPVVTTARTSTTTAIGASSTVATDAPAASPETTPPTTSSTSRPTSREPSMAAARSPVTRSSSTPWRTIVGLFALIGAAAIAAVTVWRRWRPDAGNG